MLSELHIKNFAIIEKQTVSFATGLNVISGETGAGKSIILDALKLILGGRGNAESIRTGTESLEISAVFDLSSLSPLSKNTLPESVQDLLQGTELVLTRELNKSGRNKIFINGRAGTVSLLLEVAEKLINICGQNQSLKLFDSGYHLELVDAYGGHGLILAKYKNLYTEWHSLKQKILQIETRAKDAAFRQQGLISIVEELKPIGLKSGIKQFIENDLKRLSFAEQIITSATNISSYFEGEGGTYENLQKIANSLSSLLKLDPSANKLKDLFENSRSILREFEAELVSYAANINVDEEKLRELQDKLSDIVKLERKYKTTSDGLLQIFEESKKELLLYEEGAGVSELQSKVEVTRYELLKIGANLRSLREKAAKKLIKEVESELSELNMKESRFRVKVEDAGISSFGTEKVSFEISTNKGEEFKDIRMVASGGELSRIMLVLKKVLRDRSGVHVLVFDEVDTGISGSVARAVGEKLKSLAQQSQVICITHLAQVASLADHHLLVEKTSGVRTKTVVTKLIDSFRVDEIARMLAGYKVTDASRASARELLSSNPQGK